ncbi:MAG: TniQ family protein [Chloroflexota bacterium]
MPELPQLVCRPHPFTDESLLSYLLRLSVENGYDRLSWVTLWLRDWTGIPVPPRLVTTHDLAFLKALANVAGISTSAVYHMTVNRYLPVQMPPGTALHHAALPDGTTVTLGAYPNQMKRHLRSDSATAFCPHCLATASYHRLHWLLYPVFACIQHGCWLRDTCAVCGASVSIAAVTTGQCSICQELLAQMSTLPLDALVASTQMNLALSLEGGCLPDSLTLPPLTAQALFRLLDGCMAATRQLGWSWTEHYHPAGLDIQPFPATSNHVLSVMQLGCLYTAAWDMVQDWPHRFEAFLKAYRYRPNARASGMRRELGNFYEVWLEKNWSHADFAPVQAAFNDYFVTHFPPSRELLALKRLERFPQLSQQFAYIDVRNAARSLGVSSPKITRLVRDGYIRVYPEQSANRPGPFVYRADLKTALQRQADALQFKQVAAQLEVSVPTLQAWLDAGLLLRTGERLSLGVAVPVVCTADVSTFRQRLAQQVNLRTERPDDAVNLKETCARNGKVGMTATQVIERILAGKLPAYHPDPELQPFSALWFEATDVAALTQQVKQENQWMSFLEVCALFPVSRTTLHFWISQGYLVPQATYARALYFDRATVERFRQSLLTSRDVAITLETSRSALSQWVHAGLLSVVSGLGLSTGKQFLFQKATIEAFHLTYITPYEIRRRWGEPFRRSFQNAVQEGRFPSFPDGPPSKSYLRADTEAFRAYFEH